MTLAALMIFMATIMIFGFVFLDILPLHHVTKAYIGTAIVLFPIWKRWR